MNDKIIQVTTYPFGSVNPEPSVILEASDCEVRYNPYGRRLKSEEVAHLVENVHGIVAGTEPYTRRIIENCRNLKVIARVGVGFDSVDLRTCKERDIVVTYTPEAPADGVADLTVAQIINLLRGIYTSNESVRNGFWKRVMGKLVSEVKIGVLGVGRIGKRVITRLSPFGAKIYACDLDPDIKFGKKFNIEWVSKTELFSMCDLVTVHIPMCKRNYHCISFEEMSLMQPGAFLINTSRGPILDEDSLISLLQNKHLGGVALDVFEKEPYEGELTKFDNVIFTAHIGSSANHSRYRMELEAARDCVNVLNGKEPENIVPWDDL
jgi:D-3-phosphoglycerate dehydrogenase